MKKIFKILTIFTLGILLFSCEKDFLDINTNPNASTTVDPGTLIMETMNDYSNNYMDIGPPLMYWSQHWASGSNNAGVFTEPERFGDMGWTPRNSWASFYLGLERLKLAREIAVDKGVPNGEAQCLITMAMIWYHTTCMWGDIPFTEALDPQEFPHPHFDTQETVLNGTLDILDEALALIDENDVSFDEIFYQGDMLKWKKLGNSLKLRVLNLLATKDQGTYGSQLKSLIETGTFLSSNSDNSEFPYFDEPGHVNVYYRLRELYAGGDLAYLRPSKVLVDMLVEDEDPRLYAWVENDLEDNEDNEYNGAVPGEPNLSNTSFIGLSFLSADRNQPFFLHSEVELIKSEAYAKGIMGSVDMAQANTYLRSGIASNMAYNGVSQTDIDTYLNSLVPLAQMSAEQALEKIHLEQYKALFYVPTDGWVQWKRTNVPELELPTGAYLNDFQRRFPMSIDETTANPNAISKGLTEKMWIDK